MRYAYSPENTPWMYSPHFHPDTNNWWVDDGAPEDIKKSFNDFMEGDREWRESQRAGKIARHERMRKERAERKKEEGK